jgi:ATP/maltotriose-dependent transcriptional regulator MalT
LESSARNLLASALLELDRPEDAEKEMAVIRKSSLQDPTLRLAAAITFARLQVRSGKLTEGIRELDSVATQSRNLGLAALQFEARLARGETALFGGDKRTALSLLSALQKDAARKGFRQIEVRAKAVSQQITTSGNRAG